MLIDVRRGCLVIVVARATHSQAKNKIIRHHARISKSIFIYHFFFQTKRDEQKIDAEDREQSDEYISSRIHLSDRMTMTADDSSDIETQRNRILFHISHES